MLNPYKNKRVASLIKARFASLGIDPRQYCKLRKVHYKRLMTYFTNPEAKKSTMSYESMTKVARDLGMNVVVTIDIGDVNKSLLREIQNMNKELAYKDKYRIIN